MFLSHMADARRLVLAGLALAASALLAGPAAAQQGWQFYGGAGQPGYNSPAAAGYIYSTGSAYYSAEGGTSGYITAGSAYYAPAYAYGAPYSAAPGYSYGTYSRPADTSAYYDRPLRDNEAVIDLRVPAGAVVKFDGKATAQTGASRRFVSPPLKAGREYTYGVRVEWQENGRTMDRQRTIDVRAGQRVNLDFTRADGEG